MAKAKPKRAAKAGMTADAVAKRKSLFVAAYLTNGNNATQAAISAGFSRKTAYQAGYRLLKNVEISREIGVVGQKALFDAQLSTERWAAETACSAHFDPGELYDASGNLIPIHQLPEHVRRAINLEIALADGTKIKGPNKAAALADIGKHLGVFERDNAQKRDDIKVQIQLVG